ncbi:response regulator transcription factor [Amycolatopsis sp. CA-128772]|uniref:response regulator transcription factor n=1 Tax=Amycolatopsis sp. CA-128772 TaxID=2073159 RepID=UPI000CD00CF1|nr:response regulator transcription factor [Amycolatopsis sp. CA-128772]
MGTGTGVISVVVIDDQQLSRQGMIELLAAEPGIEVVGDGVLGDAETLAMRLRPDIVLLDGEVGDGHVVAGVDGLARAAPAAKLVAVIEHDDPRFVGTLISAGAHAYVLRSATRDELLVTLRAVHRDSGHVVVSLSRAKWQGMNGTGERILSQREREVIMLVAAGMKNAEIAGRMFISEGTVKRHLTNVYNKLGVASRMAAVKKAAALGIVSFGDSAPSDG